MARTYRVDGMSCGGCVKSVSNAIAARDPAARFTVDLAGGTVRVESDTAEPVVISAIADAGFEFRGVSAS
jgi:copper chaperone